MANLRFALVLGLCCIIFTFSSARVSRSVEPDQESVVQIGQGAIQGKELQSFNGRNFHAFFGIPYGTVSERFKEAELAGPWSGTLDATQDAPPCLQIDAWFSKEVRGVEDCLTLSVYTPKLPKDGNPTELLPVMYFIHGGGFLTGEGTSSHYGPERFMDNDIVLVVIQYRLGPFGFLSTLDAASPGNNGLIDQVTGLKWTKENIQKFGGDPNKVTIFGESAGGGSVTYQVLSPLAKGLFHNAIAQSGSALCPWALQENPLNVSRVLASDLNCPTDDNNAMVECLRKVDALDILKATNATGMYTNLAGATVPVVESQEGGKFLTESPWKLLKEGRFNKVPMIIGVTEDEGALLVLLDASTATSSLKGTEADFREKILPKLISYVTTFQMDPELTQEVEKKYFQGMDFSKPTDLLTRLVNLVSDVWFKSCSDATVRYIAGQDVPVYMYVFDYATTPHSFSNLTGKPDVGHMLDLVYQFTMTEPFNFTGTFTDEENKVSKNFIEMWTNFAATSVPSPQWTPTSANEIKYLRINQNPQMETGFLEEKLKFWKSKYEDTS